MRPMLPWNVPIGGRCAQAHTVPRVQASPDAFPKRPFLHPFATSWCPHNCRPWQFTRLSTRRFEPEVSPQQGFSKHFNALSKAMTGSLRCYSHSSSRAFFLPKMLSLLDHSIPPSCRWQLSLPIGLLLFFFHSRLAVCLLLPCSSLCSDSTGLPIHPLQFLCKLPGRKRVSPHAPAAASIYRPQYGQHGSRPLVSQVPQLSMITHLHLA